jgi:hypothetical protein
MFTRSFSSLTIRTKTITIVFAMLAMVVIISVFWLAIMFRSVIAITFGTTVTLWSMIAVRLVSLHQWKRLMNHRRSDSSRQLRTTVILIRPFAGTRTGWHHRWVMRLLDGISELLKFSSRQIAIVILIKQFKDDACQY